MLRDREDLHMDAWELAELDAARMASGKLYHEFLSVPDLSGGLYVLEAGATDPQSPHTEDELYVVLSGRARITVGDEERDVSSGSVVFVGARVPHRFHDIAERLVLVVVFGPAEYSRSLKET
jgi:mannose-6-phosphate isomerase-like protein (cupin superfamily)